MTLTEFLLARIAEDEVVTRAAWSRPWTYGNIESIAGGSLYDPDVMIASIHWDNESTLPIRRPIYEQEADANGTHMARFDPARELAECEAKRMLLWLSEHGCGGDYERVQRALALPYADHPDYLPEWKP
jgi:hypothetical protein